MFAGNTQINLRNLCDMLCFIANRSKINSILICVLVPITFLLSFKKKIEFFNKLRVQKERFTRKLYQPNKDTEMSTEDSDCQTSYPEAVMR